MTLQERFNLEIRYLEKYFPGRYAFQRLFTPDAHLIMGLRTNAGRVYKVKMVLDNFPYSNPKVYIVEPSVLYDRNGQSLSHANWEMHLLESDYEGHIQICIYKPDMWNPNKTLYQAAVKTLVWLNAYDGHLRTGNPLDSFIRHY